MTSTKSAARAPVVSVGRRFAVCAASAAVLIAAAVIGQLVFSLSFEPDEPLFFFTNFFSFFTILSNVLAVIVLTASAVVISLGKRPPLWFWAVFTAMSTYMVTTGIVYNALLRGVSLDQESTLGWSNEVLHLIGPLFVAALWWFAPARAGLSWRHLRLAAVFPLAWGVYTVLRGVVVGWYPYPFMNPAQPGGYGAVLGYMAAIAAVIIGVDALLVGLSRRTRERA
ncbi:Pr6Pr family membrane protein [Leucobacter sp. L43]|uniref:Pr6Pr family membrane protein n=1 Tax=Leucobacter sp. L43 TaxID=2798040 RepID=UPI001906ED5B|nr:Pr6Pr family membrane protein [Leucobacter sp. L43]